MDKLLGAIIVNELQKNMPKDLPQYNPQIPTEAQRAESNRKALGCFLWGIVILASPFVIGITLAIIENLSTCSSILPSCR
jgi:hypothetical protein